MKTSVEIIDATSVKLTAEIEPDEVKKAFNEAAKHVARDLTIPGFRKGKVPRKVLEQHVGKGAIAQHAMDDHLGEWYLAAVEQEELAVVSQPELDLKNFDEKEGATFEATVQVRPEFDPPDHTGLSLAYPDWDVTDDVIDEELETLRQRFAEVDETDRPVERPGDFVTLDLDVAIDGEPLESAHVEDALYEVGSGGVTPRLDEELVGKAAGDTFEYVDNLPDEYPEHPGEEATFTVTVKDVRERFLPDIDDDLAQTASEFETLDELRKDIRDKALRRAIVSADHEFRGRVVEAYLANIDIPIPPAMIQERIENRMHDLEHQAEQAGVSVDDLFEGSDTTREEFEENLREQAEQAAKAQLVLDALARKLEISIENSDLDQEIMRHALNSGLPPEQVAKLIAEQGSIGSLVGDVLRRKTIDVIVEAADVDGKPSDEVLIELGLKPDPNAADDDSETSRIIVPGSEGAPGDPSELIVPGA
ncbi:MAG: trigger factor [Nitriliruptorales bacterium]|nr:trigger factor [Nitriliruptorales bacterium]